MSEKCEDCWFLKDNNGNAYCERLEKLVLDVSDDECSFDGLEVCGDWQEFGGLLWIKKKVRKLKPCPFCGGKAEFAEGLRYGVRSIRWVQCSKCRAMTSSKLQTEEEAAEDWNMRYNEEEE